MRRVTLAFGLVLAMAMLYLLLWPVPVEPVSWQAPVDRGLTDPYLPNKLLQAATGIDLGSHEGPEDATLGADNAVYATTLDGAILRVRTSGVDVFAEVGGRPLGIEADAVGRSALRKWCVDAPIREVTTLVDRERREPGPSALGDDQGRVVRR